MGFRAPLGLLTILIVCVTRDATALPGAFLSTGDVRPASDATRIVLFRDGTHTSITFQSR
jgi:hypothetical protein